MQETTHNGIACFLIFSHSVVVEVIHELSLLHFSNGSFVFINFFQDSAIAFILFLFNKSLSLNISHFFSFSKSFLFSKIIFSCCSNNLLEISKIILFLFSIEIQDKVSEIFFISCNFCIILTNSK